MEDMGALRPGLPSPTMLPRSWTLIVIDLKDCLLNPCQNSDNFAMFMFQLIPSLFFIFASVHAGEKAKGVCKHLLSAFAKLGVPKMIKTDNGPGCGAHATPFFFNSGVFNIWRVYLILPTGQAIIEQAHGTLKSMLLKQNRGNRGVTPRKR